MFLKFFVLILELRLQRYSANTKRHPHIKLLETLSLLSQLDFSKKGEVYQSWIRSCDDTGRVNVIQSLFFLEVQTQKTDSGFPKTFSGDISLYLMSIFGTAAPK